MSTSTTYAAPSRSLAAARSQFAPVPGYLNAASMGLPPRGVVQAMSGALQEWTQGTAGPAGYDDAVARSRSLFADLVGVRADQVAIGSQVSVTAGTVAASLPDGAQVLCVDGDFSSMVHPFLVHADRGVTVRHVPLDALADAVRASTALVAFSGVQSACGSVADTSAVVEAAAAHGAVTFCDLTQAAGWMPVDASRYDITVTSAYKWLCAPRGSTFTTLGDDVAERLPLRPVNAGWYAGDDVWGSCYGPGMRLAADARRFDVSPAWLAWVGTVPALELFCSLDVAEVRAWDGALADSLLVGLGLEPQGRAVVSLEDPTGRLLERLTAAGLSVAGRAGRVRLAFHLWNDEGDVERALTALRG